MKIKNKRGITLIALVITIIIILVLAGVSIITLTGDNGIIAKSKDSKIKMEKAEVMENLKLKISDIEVGQIALDEEESVVDSLESKGYITNIYKYYTYRVNVNELLNKRISTGNGEDLFIEEYIIQKKADNENIYELIYCDKEGNQVSLGDLFTIVESNMSEADMILKYLKSTIVGIKAMNKGITNLGIIKDVFVEDGCVDPIVQGSEGYYVESLDYCIEGHDIFETGKGTYDEYTGENKNDIYVIEQGDIDTSSYDLIYYDTTSARKVVGQLLEPEPLEDEPNVGDSDVLPKAKLSEIFCVNERGELLRKATALGYGESGTCGECHDLGDMYNNAGYSKIIFENNTLNGLTFTLVEQTDTYMGTEEFGGYAFYMSGLKYLKIPEGVTSIGSKFDMRNCCKDLEELVLPSTFEDFNGINNKDNLKILRVGWKKEQNSEKNFYPNYYPNLRIIYKK